MQYPFHSRTGAVILAVLSVILCPSAPGQNAPGKDAQAREADAISPRATPNDYQTHAQAGTVTIAAEFTGHSVPTPQAIFSTEDYVVVELGLFGPPDARLRMSFEDFSLRINGKKATLPAQPVTLVFKSLKDPEWTPPASAAKPKASIGAGGGGDNSSMPAVVHMPIEVERVMERRVQKASLPEGEHVLPEAGLVFFPYHGKTNGIYKIDLIYAGPAGRVTLALHP